MNHKRSLGLVLAVALAAVSNPVFGHHNTSAKYDRSAAVTVQATVTDFKMINPHLRVSFEVKQEDGTVVKWDAEGGSPSGMYRRGWRTDDLKPGDSVTVTGAPAHDGSKTMELLKLVTPNGKVLE